MSYIRKLSGIERLCLGIMAASLGALMVLFPLLIVTSPVWRWSFP
jgi:hypothetical protein